MISQEALYDFVDALITNAPPNDPLYEAVSLRNLRGSVDVARKVVRVECSTGQFNVANEAFRTEVNVQGTIQCWVLPISTDEADIYAASIEAHTMTKHISGVIALFPDLDNTICFAEFRDWETGYASLGSSRRGVSYLDGIINPANEG